MSQPPQLCLFYLISHLTYPCSLSYMFISHSISSGLSQHYPQRPHLRCLYSASCGYVGRPTLRTIHQYGSQNTLKNDFFHLQGHILILQQRIENAHASSVFSYPCLLYTSDAADERSSVDLGGRRIIKK